MTIGFWHVKVACTHSAACHSDLKISFQQPWCEALVSEFIHGYKIELFKVSVIESGTLGSNIGRVGISPSYKYLEEQEEWVRAIRVTAYIYKYF